MITKAALVSPTLTMMEPGALRDREVPTVPRSGAPATGPMHHYTFEIYALDAMIDVQPSADAFETRANVMKAIQGHVLGKAELVGTYEKAKK